MSIKDGNKSNQQSEIPQHHGISWGPLLLLFFGSLFIWGLFVVAMLAYLPDWKVRFQFDMFSAASALFSAFAFSGLIYTIILQRRDLAFQLEELQQTREELRGQKEQLAAQNVTFRRQSFETRFFEWIKLHHEITNAIEFQSPHRGLRKGRDCFGSFIELMRINYVNFLLANSPQGEKERKHGENNSEHIERLRNQIPTSTKDIAITVYESVYTQIQGNIGHYFRNLYNLVKFVNNSDISQREKRFYTNIVRAQLSSYELALLFYNCLSPQGYKKFKPLIEQFGLLKNMDSSLLISSQLIDSYTIWAFQGTPDTFEDGS